MRPLLTLLIVVLTLAASGISSVIAATEGDDDCCADGGDDEAPEQERPDGERDRCPPLCHGCACSPMFSVPATVSVDRVVGDVDLDRTLEGSSQLPPSPPGEGVFHPPRRSI